MIYYLLAGVIFLGLVLLLNLPSILRQLRRLRRQVRRRLQERQSRE
jgi:hypothetical protein